MKAILKNLKRYSVKPFIFDRQVCKDEKGNIISPCKNKENWKNAVCEDKNGEFVKFNELEKIAVSDITKRCGFSYKEVLRQNKEQNKREITQHICEVLGCSEKQARKLQKTFAFKLVANPNNCIDTVSIEITLKDCCKGKKDKLTAP